MAHLYYTEIDAGAQRHMGDLVAVTGDEARHAVRVSRLRVGEGVLVGDGVGTQYFGEVVSAERDRFEIRVTEVLRHKASPVQLTLVQALAKGDRDERAVEQATEFGVDRIVPWEAERSVSRWGSEKAVRGTEKWQRIAREAAKQSLRAYVPQVHAPVTTEQLASWVQRNDTRVLVLHPRGTTRLSEWAQQLRQEAADSSISEVCVMIGPEGGVSDAELERLSAAGAQIVLLGEQVLRTSSAGPAALAILNVALGRW